MAFSSAPARALTAEDAEFENAEFAEDFVLLNLDVESLDPASLDAVSEEFARATRSAACLGLLLTFFSAFSAVEAFSPASSAFKVFRFESARAIASASHAAFTLPRDAGRLLFHSAES